MPLCQNCQRNSRFAMNGQATNSADANSNSRSNNNNTVAVVNNTRNMTNSIANINADAIAISSTNSNNPTGSSAEPQYMSNSARRRQILRSLGPAEQLDAFRTILNRYLRLLQAVEGDADMNIANPFIHRVRPRQLGEQSMNFEDSHGLRGINPELLALLQRGHTVTNQQRDAPRNDTNGDGTAIHERQTISMSPIDIARRNGPNAEARRNSHSNAWALQGYPFADSDDDSDMENGGNARRRNARHAASRTTDHAATQMRRLQQVRASNSRINPVLSSGLSRGGSALHVLLHRNALHQQFMQSRRLARLNDATRNANYMEEDLRRSIANNANAFADNIFRVPTASTNGRPTAGASSGPRPSSSRAPTASSSRAPTASTSRSSRSTSRASRSTTSRDPTCSTSSAPRSSTSRSPRANTSSAPRSSTSRGPRANTSSAPRSSTSRGPRANTSRAPRYSTSRGPRANTSSVPWSSTSRGPRANTSMTTNRPTSVYNMGRRASSTCFPNTTRSCCTCRRRNCHSLGRPSYEAFHECSASGVFRGGSCVMQRYRALFPPRSAMRSRSESRSLLRQRMSLRSSVRYSYHRAQLPSLRRTRPVIPFVTISSTRSSTRSRRHLHPRRNIGPRSLNRPIPLSAGVRSRNCNRYDREASVESSISEHLCYRCRNLSEHSSEGGDQTKSNGEANVGSTSNVSQQNTNHTLDSNDELNNTGYENGRNDDANGNDNFIGSNAHGSNGNINDDNNDSAPMDE